MKLLEYVWLALTLILFALTSVFYTRMETNEKWAIGLAAGTAAFMYSFRRSQRLKTELKAKQRPTNEN